MNQNILDYGAIGDGQTMSTVAIQKAVDTCAETGGGYVYVPQGEFITGTIYLQSNVFLYICPGGKLLGSMAFKDYSGTQRGSAWGGAVKRMLDKLNNPCFALVIAENMENCGILGDGEIDGRRDKRNTQDPEVGTPFLVVFSRCKRVKLDGVTLRNPGMFTSYMLACEDVNITRVKVYSEDTPCGDGLDFDGGRNVTISNCIICSGDDGIGLKTLTPSEPCENFVIQNCYIRTKIWGCVRIGPESAADMRHITVTNCVFENSNDGFKLQLCEDAVFEYFDFSNITMNGVVRPFFFTNNSFSMSEYDKSVRPKCGAIRYINVSNVTAQMIQRPEPYSADPTDLHFSCNYIYNLLGAEMHDIKFSNLHITCVGGGATSENERADHGEMVDYIDFYPEICREVGIYPAAAMYIKNCDSITLDNVSIDAKEFDARPAIAAEAVNDLYCHHVTTTNTAFLLRDIACTDVELVHCKGNLMPISTELRSRWQENREYALALLQEYEQDATLLDQLIVLPAQSVFDGNTGHFTADGKSRYFLYTFGVKGDFDLLVKGSQVDSRRTQPKYRRLNAYAKEITEFVTVGENEVSLSFCEADGKLAKPIYIVKSEKS